MPATRFSSRHVEGQEALADALRSYVEAVKAAIEGDGFVDAGEERLLEGFASDLLGRSGQQVAAASVIDLRIAQVMRSLSVIEVSPWTERRDRETASDIARLSECGLLEAA